MQCNWQDVHWEGRDPLPFREKEGEEVEKGRCNWIGLHDLWP